jgi:hypothetical protein
MRFERFVGAVLVIATGLLWLNSAAEAFLKNPAIGGALLALCTLSAGIMACASIWRDRL